MADPEGRITVPAKGWTKDEAGEWHPPSSPVQTVVAVAEPEYKERRYKRPVYIHGHLQPTREGRRW